MTRAFSCIALISLLSMSAFSQSSETPTTFEIADIHASPRSTTTAMRASTRPGRYEVHNATMVDLIRTAYGFDPDKILAGPNWLEYDRFEVIAKTPPKTPDAETLKVMLQNLLAERFKLVVRKDTQPVTGLVLALGKGKPKMKESDGKGETGCKSQPQPPPTPAPGTISLPMVGYSCHNMTMETFAAALRNIGAGYVTNAVTDSTELKGSWDFDIKFNPRVIIFAASADTISLSDAIDKQLGLKLEERKIPTPVLIVDRVDKKPSDNSPDVAKQLPPPPPVEFEVANIKPSTPITPATIGLLQSQAPAGFFPGGRVNLPRFPLLLGIQWAWSLATTDDIVDPPKWLSSANFDIIAKAPPEVSPVSGNAPLQDLGPMLKALFIDRFKMKAHFEERPVNAYTLVAAKPKLKNADPTGRTGCKTANATSGAAASSPFGGINLPGRTVTCLNMTMAQFADQLQTLAGNYVHYQVTDSTGLEGAFDFSFTYSPINPTQLAGLRGAPPPGAPDPGASDPVGGTTLLDA